MRVVIAGSRSIAKPIHVLTALRRSGLIPYITEVVSGGAKGVDTIGEEWARRRGIPVKVFKPNYTKYKPGTAPLIRNTQMADYAANAKDGGALVAIHDGVSTGTQHMITQARKRGLAIHVETIDLSEEPQPTGPKSHH